MHHRIGAEGHFSGFGGPGQSGSITTEIATQRATPLTQGTVGTLAPALLQVDGLRLGNVGTTTNDHGPRTAVFLGHRLAEVLLHAIHLVRRQKLAIGQLGQPIAVATDACKFFYVAIPRRNVGIANRPVYGETVAGGAFKIEFRPALGLPGPKQRLTTHLVAPNPVKRFFLDVRVLRIFDKKLLGGFTKGVTFAHNGVGFGYSGFELTPMRELPGMQLGRGIIHYVFDFAATLQHQGF